MVRLPSRWIVCCTGVMLGWLVISSLPAVPSSAQQVPQQRAASDQVFSVQPTVETQPVPHNNDAADDPAIWIHPSDPSLSLVIGSDKGGGIGVYDLAGKQVQYLAAGRINNIDLRYNFPLGGQRVALLTGSNQSTKSISVFRINPDTRRLEDVAARVIKTDINLYGTCMYHSPFSGKFYTFMTKSPYPLDDPRANTGEVQQFELFDNGGKVDARKVRTFRVGSDSEGCVADDELGQLYIAQTKKGIWQYGAEPDAGSSRVSIGAVGDGHLLGELEGLSIYYTSHKTGYLIVSQQCCSSYAVYRREGRHEFVMSFNVVANLAAGIDNVTGTDGLDVTNVPLGSAFPQGMLVLHDTRNDPGASSYTNFKLVPWDAVAHAPSVPLEIDTSWDPREIGSPDSPLATVTPTLAPSPSPTETMLPATPPAATIAPYETVTSTATIAPNVTTTPDGNQTPEPTHEPLTGTYRVLVPIFDTR